MAVISLAIVVGGYQWNGLQGSETFGMLMILQSVMLGVMGASQVAASVGKARESGILDFHRVTPMSPFSLALGFFFGAPIREYLMFAVTLPFSMVCVFMGRPSPLGAIQLLFPLILGAWVMHAIALLNALAGKSGKSNSGSRGVIGLVMFLVFGGSWFVPSFFSAATVVDEFPTGTVYGIRIPWLMILPLDLLPVIGFFLVGATRKIASERAHTLSKGQALGALTTAAVLIVGGLWDIEVHFIWTLVVLYGLVVGSIVLTSAITPNLDEFAKGIRKAAKEGRKYPSAWSDRGLNRIDVFCFGAVVLIAATVCWRMIEKPVAWVPAGSISYSLPIAIGVLVVAYNGLALQYFLLRFGKRGPVVYALFLFTVWLLPPVCGAISAAARAQTRTPDTPADIWSPALASLSPVAGIVISSGIFSIPGIREAQACALVPALVLALLFNNLVTSIRRGVEKKIHPADESRTSPDKPTELVPILA